MHQQVPTRDTRAEGANQWYVSEGDPGHRKLHQSDPALPVTCVHGDTRYVPAHTVTISAAPDAWAMQVGVLKDLPVPLLLVRDWSGLDRLLRARPSSYQPTTRRPPRKVSSHPVYLATESNREGESQN